MSKFKVGDTVRVVKRVSGCGLIHWNDSMDRYLGRAGIVSDASHALYKETTYRLEGMCSWRFTESALELAAQPFTINEPGFYKMRNGNKMEVLAIRAALGQTPVVGWCENHRGQPFVACWSRDGKLAGCGTTYVPQDIIGVWVEPHPAESWPVDAKILVRDRPNQEWAARHFAAFENGSIYAWEGGGTSHTMNGRRSSWAHAQLAD